MVGHLTFQRPPGYQQPPSKTLHADSGRTLESKPICVRISGIPETWTKDDLTACVRFLCPQWDILDKDTKRISLFKPDFDSRIGLINLQKAIPYFDDIFMSGLTKSENIIASRGSVKMGGSIELRLDSTFYNMTPLNLTADVIRAELVPLPLTAR